jgi:hypothetical protein
MRLQVSTQRRSRSCSCCLHLPGSRTAGESLGKAGAELAVCRLRVAGAPACRREDK